MQGINLKIKCLKEGTLGGNQEPGTLISRGEINIAFFLRDPISAQHHEPDINRLAHLCDIYSIPIATNIKVAGAVLSHLKTEQEGNIIERQKEMDLILAVIKNQIPPEFISTFYNELSQKVEEELKNQGKEPEIDSLMLPVLNLYS